MSTESIYPHIPSTLDLRAPQYQANREQWKSVMDQFEDALKQVSAEGNAHSLERHQARGQLLPRDRISLLLDQDSPFLELGCFAGFGNEKSTPSANLIAGIGSVSGRPCLLMSHIPTQKGGSWNEMTVLKTNRIMEIAFENDLVLISLVQSAGVFLPEQFKVFHKGGQLFRDLAVRTSHGKPSCAIVFGSSTAGGAYHPALSDYSIFVENAGQAFLGGPPLVKMATGEVVDAEELGGAKVHAQMTGLADQIAVDEFDAIQKTREWVSSLRVPSPGPGLRVQPIKPLPPRYDIEDLLSLVNPDIRKPFDMREVILRLVDDSRLAEFKPTYGRNMITAWAHIFGYPVGIIANRLSVINSTEASKGAQFIRMCNQQNTPLIFLHNVTGFMVGTKAEHSGIIKLGAQLVSAVSCSTVPHISIIMGASYGAGNYAMCGRAYKPRFLFTWPIGRCSVMGPEQVEGVMGVIQGRSGKKEGGEEGFSERVRRDAEAYSTSGMLIDDGIIDPRDTRDVLGVCLEVVTVQGVEGTRTHRAMASQQRNQRSPLYVANRPTDENGVPIIRRLLIANRGEIAVRFIRTCRTLGIVSVAVYVEEDATSLHVTSADESICLGSVNNAAKNPFLDIDLLVNVAVRADVQAIHPGYGYLSENATFATKVREAGLIFIGPSASAMLSLGDKRSAKEYLRQHAPDVPLIPGFAGSSQDADALAIAAGEIGYPVMVKASAGGGGKGMRVVREAGELKGELERARSEAQRAFGVGDCILEKYIDRAKHVEIQIMGDSYGEVISFYDRDCSVQRRHQKVIEETPCGYLTESMRRDMSETAVRIAKLIGYENAGTVEFVVDVAAGNFYFLEVNARLQVEHPITEEVTGFDLVSLQLFVAAGGSLRDVPRVSQTGHAIECRLCAEDPNNNFFPEHGKIDLWRPADAPLGPGRDIRYETAIHTGSDVSIYFDSMIAKIVVWAPTRDLAIKKTIQVLAHTACCGVRTNQLFLQRCLSHAAFQNDPEYTTSFIPTHLDALLAPVKTAITPLLPVLPALVIRKLAESPTSTRQSPFQSIRKHFRNQSFDPVNIHSDILTSVSGPLAKTSTLAIWEPPAPGTPEDTDRVRLYPIPPADPTSDNTASSQYNVISNMLRTRSSTAGPYAVEIASWHPITDPTTTTAIHTKGGRNTTHVSSLAISINNIKIPAYIAIPSGTSIDINNPYQIHIHTPLLGTYITYTRDTQLTFAHSLRAQYFKTKHSGPGSRSIPAPMPCKILSIEKKSGEEVSAGETVIVIESMKMEVSIRAEVAGKFRSRWNVGDAVGEGDVLCEVL
ncbi:carboxyl transferase domain-containing protein [Aspergillus californicus]